MTTAFQYVQQNGGIDSEDAYPYVGQVSLLQCAVLCWFFPRHGFVSWYCVLPSSLFFLLILRQYLTLYPKLIN